MLVSHNYVKAGLSLPLLLPIHQHQLINISVAHLTQRTPNFVLNFQTFFSGWLIGQQNFFDHLLSATSLENIRNNEQHQDLIDQVLSHYQQYYEEKSSTAREDVFLLRGSLPTKDFSFGLAGLNHPFFSRCFTAQSRT